MEREPRGCGLEAALDVIAGKWKPLVLWRLTAGPRRFGELRRLVTGISEKMLIQQLREMERDGIVARKDFQEIPPRVEYALTDLGTSLTVALGPLCEWGTRHLVRIEDAGARCDLEPVGVARDQPVCEAGPIQREGGVGRGDPDLGTRFAR
jgi:DNA-binding HxlR family transcriptional regulator